jgi:hypothetical protein
MDPQLDAASDTFRTAVLLLSLALVGVTKVRSFTGYTGAFVNGRIARLRQNGILERGGAINANWFNDGGGFDFWMDVCVAEGLMERSR